MAELVDLTAHARPLPELFRRRLSFASSSFRVIMMELAAPYNASLPIRSLRDILGHRAAWRLAAFLLCLPTAWAGSLEDRSVKLVVRADPRTGRLVRRVVAPAIAVPPNVLRPVEVSARPGPVKLLAAHPVGAPASRDQPNGDEALRGQIAEISETHRVDPLLVHAVIHVESRYNRYAISPKGAEGLMQLIPSTARLMGVRNSFSTRENIGGGVKYLRKLMDRFSDLRHVLAAYNAGPEAVARWGGIPPYAETQDYVYKVGKRYGELRRAESERAAPEAVGPPPVADAEPEHRPLESFIDEQGRLHLRTR